MGRLLLLALLLGLGCRSSTTAPDPAAAASIGLVSVPWVDDPALVGVSGVGVRSEAEIWFAPERSRHLVYASWDGRRLGPPVSVPVDGLDPELDVEGLGFIDANHLVLSTEGPDARDEDRLLLVALDTKGGARVERELRFEHRFFAMRAEGNRGLEGVCAVNGWVIASSETVRSSGDKREAPIGVFTPGESGFSGAWVELSSATGKLSDLACEMRADHVRVHAIERHFGVVRLIRFELPRSMSAEPVHVRAEVVRDLVPALGSEAPNLEGLARLPDGRWLLVSDNHYGRKTGPTLVFALEP